MASKYLETGRFQAVPVDPMAKDRFGEIVTGTHKVDIENEPGYWWPIAWGMDQLTAERVAACLNALQGHSTQDIIETYRWVATEQYGDD